MLFYITLLLVGAMIYWKHYRFKNYWKKKGIMQKEPFPFLGENVGIIFKTENFSETISNVYNFAPNSR